MISITDLASKHGVPRNYLSSMASLGKWSEHRDELHSRGRAEAASVIFAGAQERVAGLMQPVTATADEQLVRSKMTGDKLYILFQSAVSSLESGDLRQMRVAIDSWVTLDDHMRTVHGLDVEKERPLVNIQVMGALPDLVKVMDI